MPAATKGGATMPKNAASSKELANRNASIFNLYHYGEDGKRYRQVDLAEKFGLSQGAISQIVNNPNSHLYTEA